MAHDMATTARLRELISKLIALTSDHVLHWERRVNTAHRYATWNNNLLILGPDAPLSDSSEPRYLFITPFDSPQCIEVSSNDEELGPALLKLVGTVEAATSDEPPSDPFALSDEFLSSLTD
jgi:hypothetical protein